MLSRIPRWIQKDQQLWFDGKVIIEFRRAALSEEKLLKAFQRGRWRRRIANPWLGGHRAIKTAQNACALLNAHQSVIRFRTCNSGTQISWELTKD